MTTAELRMGLLQRECEGPPYEVPRVFVDVGDGFREVIGVGVPHYRDAITGGKVLFLTLDQLSPHEKMVKPANRD